jgi:hypothetical protein
MKGLSKWQQLNLRSGSTSTQTVTQENVTFGVFTGVSEMTVPFPSTWLAVLPEITVFDSEGIPVNQNRYTPHVASDHVRITIRPAGDYVVKVRA